jgi:serine kinase of HPr protein (carbohydrate metabolism regulator)
MIQDDLIERLGRSQQKIMSLSVRCRHLEMAEQRARERAEVLEELVMDIVADIKEIVPSTEILERIRKVIEKLDEDQADD